MTELIAILTMEFHQPPNHCGGDDDSAAGTTHGMEDCGKTNKQTHYFDMFLVHRQTGKPGHILLPNKADSQ